MKGGEGGVKGSKNITNAVQAANTCENYVSKQQSVSCVRLRGLRPVSLYVFVLHHPPSVSLPCLCIGCFHIPSVNMLNGASSTPSRHGV